MSKDDIDKAVKEAEQYAAEDKKRREEVDNKNEAENLVFQTEKAMEEEEQARLMLLKLLLRQTSLN